jgi:hypothetical protein
VTRRIRNTHTAANAPEHVGQFAHPRSGRGTGSSHLYAVVYSVWLTGRTVESGVVGMVSKSETTQAVVELVRLDFNLGRRGSTSCLATGVEFASDLVVTEGEDFHESGTITFLPGADPLRFSSTGGGKFNQIAGSAIRHGAVIWRIEGGEGVFSGSSGVILSNFVITDDGQISDHQIGVVVWSSDPWEQGKQRRET